MSTIFSNGRSFPLPYQFSDHRLSTFAMDGTGVIAVDREAPGSAAAGAFSVTKFSPTGDTILKRQYPYVPKAMPEAEVARIVRETRSRFERLRRSPTLGLDVEPPSAAQIERALRERGIPRFLTPITSVQSGQDGTIWLGGDDSSSETRRWYVIDTHGALVATATLPRRETVIAARDQLLITTYTDDLDVPYVAGYLLPET
jgi:hypothetical protein